MDDSSDDDDEEDVHPNAERLPYHPTEALQLSVMDARRGLTTSLDANTDTGNGPLNTCHAFECPAGAFMLTGMAHTDATGSRATQQLLLYKLSSPGSRYSPMCEICMNSARIGAINS